MSRHFAYFLAIGLSAGSPTAGFAQGDPATDIRMMGRCDACVVQGQSFDGARLTGIGFGEAKLTDVSFAGADMSISVFDGAVLTNVQFGDADLSGASFVGAQLINVSFAGANLRGAVFEGARLTGTDLSLAHLCKTQLPDDSMGNAACN